MEILRVIRCKLRQNDDMQAGCVPEERGYKDPGNREENGKDGTAPTAAGITSSLATARMRSLLKAYLRQLGIFIR